MYSTTPPTSKNQPKYTRLVSGSEPVSRHRGKVRTRTVTWGQRTLADPLSVTWTPRADGIGSKPTEERIMIRVRPVAKSDHEVAARLIASVVLPDLASWIDKAMQSSEVWQDARHERNWSIHGESVDTHEDDGMHIVDRDRG